MPSKKAPPYADYANAIHDLESNADAVITMAFIEDWLSKYKELYEQYMFANSWGIDVQFYEIYKYFSKTFNCYKLRPACEEALEEYHAIRKVNRRIKGNHTLMDWTAKYEQIGLSEYLYHNRFCIDPANAERIIRDTSYLILGIYFISVDEFKSIMEFQKVFAHLFWKKKVIPERLDKFNEEQDAKYEEARAAEELLDEIESATPIETRSITEIEKELISHVPAPLFNMPDALKKGLEHFHAQDYKKAIEYYTKVADRQLSDTVSFCLALSYYLNADYANARQAIDRYQPVGRACFDTAPNLNVNQFYELLQLKIAS